MRSFVLALLLGLLGCGGEGADCLTPSELPSAAPCAPGTWCDCRCRWDAPDAGRPGVFSPSACGRWPLPDEFVSHWGGRVYDCCCHRYDAGCR